MEAIQPFETIKALDPRTHFERADVFSQLDFWTFKTPKVLLKP